MRSKDGGASLGARGSHDGRTEGKSASYVPEARRDIPERLTTRDAVEDFMTAVANMNAREPDVEQEEYARGPSDNAIDVVERNDATESPGSTLTQEDFLSAMLSDRDFISGQDMQARSFWDDALNIGMNLLGQVLRRDVDPGQNLAARDDAEDFVNSILNSRDSNSDFAKVLNALGSSRRDVASDELDARDDWEDFVKMLNTRKLVFKRDMQASGLFTGFLS